MRLLGCVCPLPCGCQLLHGCPLQHHQPKTWSAGLPGGWLLRDGNVSRPVPWTYALRGPRLEAGSRAPVGVSPFTQWTERDPPPWGGGGAAGPAAGGMARGACSGVAAVWARGRPERSPHPEDGSASQLCAPVGQGHRCGGRRGGYAGGLSWAPRWVLPCGQPRRLLLGSALAPHVPQHPGVRQGP